MLLNPASATSSVENVKINVHDLEGPNQMPVTAGMVNLKENEDAIRESFVKNQSHTEGNSDENRSKE